jgi:indolepyruvate ferredoxin oxidoreductase
MLRGTAFDFFGYAAVRQEERRLIAWYRNLVEELLARLAPGNLSLALEIASLPEHIRGYEQIKLSSIREVEKLAQEKLGLFKQSHAGASPVAL